VFNIMNHFLEENEIKLGELHWTLHWWSPVNICVKCRTSGPGKKESPLYYLTHCMHHRQELASRNMSEELQTVFHVVIRFVNLSQKQSTDRKIIYSVMWRYGSRTHSAPVLLWNMLALLCQSASQSIWIERGNSHFSKLQ